MIRAAKYDDRRPVLNGNSPTRTLGWSKKSVSPLHCLPLPTTISISLVYRLVFVPPGFQRKVALLKRFVEDEKERITGRALFVISWRCKNPRNSPTPSPKWNFAGENLIYDRRETHFFHARPPPFSPRS